MVSKLSILIDKMNKNEDGTILSHKYIDRVPVSLSKTYNNDADINSFDDESSTSSFRRKSGLRELFYNLLDMKQFNFNSNYLSDLLSSDGFEQYQQNPSCTRIESKLEEEDYLSTERLMRDLIETVTIMDRENDSRAQQLLIDFNGHLFDISLSLVGEILKKVPVQFSARVADFNENLFYAMQERGSLRNIIQNKIDDESPHDSNIDRSVEELEDNIRQALGLDDKMAYQGSFMKTDHTQPQPAHVDFKWETLEALNEKLFIGFFPLSKEGMFLQLWDNHDTMAQSSKNDDYGRIVFIPLGKFLVVPSDTIHGGGFKVGSGGNPRYHMYIASDNNVLPKFQNNRYTEKYDKSKELCDRLKNSPKLDCLVEEFFD